MRSMFNVNFHLTPIWEISDTKQMGNREKISISLELSPLIFFGQDYPPSNFNGRILQLWKVSSISVCLYRRCWTYKMYWWTDKVIYYPPPPKKKKKKKKCLQGIIIMGRGRSCNRWMSVSSELESYQGLIKVVS